MTLQHFDFRIVACGRDAFLHPLTIAGPTLGQLIEARFVGQARARLV